MYWCRVSKFSLNFLCDPLYSPQGFSPRRMDWGWGRHLLLCERAQQKATMVAISTRNATPAPTATPMITAIGTDSARGRRGEHEAGLKVGEVAFPHGTHPWLLERGSVMSLERVLGPSGPPSPLPCPDIGTGCLWDTWDRSVPQFPLGGREEEGS